jgi:hypothetical protein
MDNDELRELLLSLKPILTKVEDNSITLSSLDNRLSLTVEDMKRLSKLLYEGNGQPSILTRITALEASLELVKEDVRSGKEIRRQVEVNLSEYMQRADKAALEHSMAIEGFLNTDRERREVENAKNLLHYGWGLNVAQALVILVLSTAGSFLGGKLYINWRATHPPLEQVATPSPSR